MQQHPSQQRLPLVRLTTLGPFVLERLHMQAGHEPTYTTLTSKEIHGRGKVLTMLKILVCQRHRRATRDKLIDLLWSEDEQHEMKDVRGALKTMAVVLRDFLRVGSDESLLITISPSDELMLAGQDAIWVDADAFEALVQQAVRVPAADALPLWERAHALAGGEFLADEPYSEWATPRREALHGKMGQCTVALADLYTAHARLDLAQEILWDAATAEYPNEDALCRLLLLLERQERYHDAWNLYKNTKREFAKYERKLSSRVRELGIRIREKLEGIEPYKVTSRTANTIVPVPSVSTVSEAIHPSLSLSSPSADSEASEAFFSNLQKRLCQTVTIMEPENQNDTFSLSRREALVMLTTMTITFLTEGQQKLLTSLAIDELVALYTAGVTACRQLSRGPDILFTYSTLSRYLSILLPIAKHPSAYQKSVADLLAQGFLLKSSLGRHVEGLYAAEVACQNALQYSKLAGNLVLYITTLRHLAMIYYYAKRHKEEYALYEHIAPFLIQEQIPPLVQSFVYAGWAGCQAVIGQRKHALTSLVLARETFFAQPETEEIPSYIDYDFSQLVISEGLTYSDLGEYKNAIATFLEVDGLHPKVPIAERGRLEFLNCQALALLHLPERDKEMHQCITYWTAGMKGAIAIKSKQRFEEACHIYEFMNFVWPHEKKIHDLKEITQQWEEKIV